MAHHLEMILSETKPFLDRVFETLQSDNIDVSAYELDHICYRVEKRERYEELKGIMNDFWELLSEAQIGGRPIATYKLQEAILYGNRSISCLELPSPKIGSPYNEGYEHVEFVINTGFDEFLAKNSKIDFDVGSMNKGINPDVSKKYDGFAVKFHRHTLEYVVKYLQW